MTLSVVIITFNEQANLPRTLESVKWADEIIVVDSLSTDRTVEIAKSYGAKVFVEPWKGFAPQKNSALEKAKGDWILSLDADEEVSPALREEVLVTINRQRELERAQGISDAETDRLQALRKLMEQSGIPANRFRFGYFVPRRNLFLNRWIRHGGFYPDGKMRLFRRGSARFEERLVHEDAQLTGIAGNLMSPLIHHAYPTLTSYIEHMNRYSSLGAQMALSQRSQGFSFVSIVLRPIFTMLYNYFFRLGFLDGREGLLLHLYHSVYVSWKYAKAWELSRQK